MQGASAPSTCNHVLPLPHVIHNRVTPTLQTPFDYLRRIFTPLPKFPAPTKTTWPTFAPSYWTLISSIGLSCDTKSPKPRTTVETANRADRITRGYKFWSTIATPRDAFLLKHIRFGFRLQLKTHPGPTSNRPSQSAFSLSTRHVRLARSQRAPSDESGVTNTD